MYHLRHQISKIQLVVIVEKQRTVIQESVFHSVGHYCVTRKEGIHGLSSHTTISEI